MKKKKKLITLDPAVLTGVIELSPIANAGTSSGRPSVSLLLGEVLTLGRLAAPLAPPGELPWAAVRELVAAAVERKAPRRVRT